MHRLYSVGIRKKTCNLKIVGFLGWISGILVASCFANRRGLTYWNVIDLKQIRVVPYMWEITNRDPWKKRTKMRETIILISAVCFSRSLRLLKLSGGFCLLLKVNCQIWTTWNQEGRVRRSGLKCFDLHTKVWALKAAWVMWGCCGQCLLKRALD